MKHKWKKKRFQTAMDIRQEFCETCGKTRKVCTRWIVKDEDKIEEEDCPGSKQ